MQSGAGGYFAGLDIGSTITKVVVMAEDVLASVVEYTAPEQRKLANKVMEEALDKAGLSLDEISYIVATGYGRINVPFADRQITEISCHARGLAYLLPTVRTAIDIGGQDCKGIKLKNGKVSGFVMNDKCAAGTGRFLEVIAEGLGVRLENLGELSLASESPVKVSSTCTVFAEQEVVSRLTEGAKLEDLAAGIHEAIAGRICAMVGKLNIERDVVVTGGGAKNVGLVRAIESKLGFPVLLPPDPLLTGAIGAALLGKETVQRAVEKGEIPTRSERRLEEARFYA
ncbi:MAG: acyl-CoA dehydratase activase [Chloroflexota bacterium]